MGSPTPSTVRDWLSALWTLLSGWATNNAAIITELRFIERRMFGADSTGALDADSLRARLEQALFWPGFNEFEEPDTLSLSQMIQRQFGNMADPGVLFWLQNIRISARFTELYLQPSTETTSRTSRLTEIIAAINAIAGPSPAANMQAVLSALHSIDLGISGGSLGSTTGVKAQLTEAIQLLECLKDGLAPDCVPVEQGAFPAVPSCDELYPNLVAIAVNSGFGLQAGLAQWNWTLQPGAGSDWGTAQATGGGSVLTYLGADGGPREVQVYLQRKAGTFEGLATDWYISAALLPSATGEPNTLPQQVPGIEGCFTVDLYTEETGEPNRPVGYTPVLTLPEGSPSLVPGVVRVLVFAGAFG